MNKYFERKQRMCTVGEIRRALSGRSEQKNSAHVGPEGKGI